MIVLHTNYGPITLELDAEKAPKTVENFLEYVNQGYYDNTIFHRVIDGFMIQGGGFEAGMVDKKPLKPIQNEANNGLRNRLGTIAMARTSDPHSASAQFFINVADNGFLDHRAPTVDGWGYCVFGHVTDGLETIQKIAKVKTTRRMGHDDVPVDDVIIEKVEVIATV